MGNNVWLGLATERERERSELEGREKRKTMITSRSKGTKLTSGKVGKALQGRGMGMSCK